MRRQGEMIVRSIALASLTLLGAGCDKGNGVSATATDSAPAVPVSTTAIPTTTPIATAAPSAPTAAPSAAASAGSAAHPATCEVEVFGKVDLPKPAPTGKAVVYVAQDDCLSASPKMLGHAPVKPDGGFFIEIFPKWGTDISICAALEKPDGTSEHYGKAVNKDTGGKFHAEAAGEVTFEGVTVPIRKGPSRKFAQEPK